MLPEIVELPGHPWFVGVQYHPELKSKPFDAASAVRRLHRRRRAAGPPCLNTAHGARSAAS